MNSPVHDAMREGFQLTPKPFIVPADTTRLDPATKRKTTICNLFVNHQLPIRDIVRVLDETYGSVVRALIESGVVYERRRNRQETVKVERRHSFFKGI